MSNISKDAAIILEKHRESIDRLDAILIYTLGERFKHTEDIGKLKAKHSLDARDPKREKMQIERLKQISRQANLKPEFATQFLKFIIREVVQNHKSHQTSGICPDREAKGEK